MIADILLVDDNEIQAATRKAVLSAPDRTILTAANAPAALELLHDAELRQSVALVITDHWMPGMNGPEFVTCLRQLLPELPVLVLSGLPDAETEYEGMNVVFRLKPVGPEQLRSLVKSFLDAQIMGRTA